ncbi:MAG: YfhO family protein [Candidatus Levybacteria bacterium]|nr:YfhO family protein [Candidatus Levybacteria bacterium]
MKKDIIWIVLLFIVILFFFKPIFLNQVPIPADTLVNLFHPFRDLYESDFPRGVPYKNPLVGDPVLQQIPWRELSIDILKKGELPLWNPYQMAGYPLSQNIQSASFYPLNIIFFLLPFIDAWSIYIILQVILGGVYMYLYLRNQRISTQGAFFGSIAFSFSGFSVSWLEWGVVGHTALWAPLLLLSVDKFFEQQKYRWLFILLVGLTCSALGGHLQTYIYVIALFCAYVLYRTSFLRKYVREFFYVVLVFILSALLLSPVLFGQMQFILISARNIDQSWSELGWFIPLQNLIQFVAPNFFGNPATGNYWGIWNYGEFIGYIGVIPFFFVIFALFHKVKDYLFWLTILIFVFIFAFDTQIARIPYQLSIPFLSSAQPTRLIFLADVALCILAAKGFEMLIMQKRNVLAPILFFSGTFLLVFLYSFFGQKLGVISEENMKIALKNFIIPLILLFSIIILFVANFYIKYISKHIVIFVILLITVVDLLFFAQKYTPFTTKEYFYPYSKTITYLTSQKELFRIMTTDRSILHPNIATFYRIQSIDGYDPLYIQRLGEFMIAIDRNEPNITPPFGYNRIVHKGYRQSPFYDLLGVKYILSLTDLKEKTLKKVYQEGETRVYENRNAFPRAFFVGAVAHALTKDDAIQMIFDKKNLLKDVGVVEGKNISGKYSVGKVLIDSYTENKIVITTNNEGEGFLVLTDTHYPSWSVLIDGEKSSIILTDFAFRGVVVPKGVHKIEFINKLL